MTRRAFGRILGAAFGIAGVAPSAGRLSWNDLGTPAVTLERRYRADAQILVLSVPLLHRQGVGGGTVRWVEGAAADGGTLRLLEFLGYSLPGRAAGLNRLGFIRELSRVSAGKSAESVYFGLMTASGEESAEQARAAIHSTAKEQAYTVIDGRVTPAGSTAAVAHFAAPSALTAEHRPELMERSRKALAAEARESSGPAGSQSFLQAVAELLGEDRRQTTYLYSGGVYSLWMTRAADTKATAYFRDRRLIARDRSVVRLSGKLRRQVGGKDIEFRLWVEQGAARPVPLRIEYQAKSYLRLVFEAENV